MRSCAVGAIIFGVVSIWVSCRATWADPLVIRDYDDARHERFYSGMGKDFIGEEYDWSGVGRVQNEGPPGGFWSHATLISDSYYLTSAHLAASEGDIRFYPTNDPNGDFWEAPLDDTFGTRIAGTDLWLGRLSEAAPEWVRRYPIINRPDQTNYFSYLDPEVFIYGHSDDSVGHQSVAIGTNSIDRIGLELRSPTGEIISWSYDEVSNGDEAHTVTGNSSAPTFVVSPAGLALAGIHWVSDGDTSTSFYADEIQNTVDTASGGNESVHLVTDITGDFNGDLSVDLDDLIILSANYNQSGTFEYFDGDINGDTAVTLDDLIELQVTYNQTLTAPADFNQNFRIDAEDFAIIGNNWNMQVTSGTNGDANADGYVDLSDVDSLQANFRIDTFVLPEEIPVVIGDVDHTGTVDTLDIGIVNAHWQQSVTPWENGDADGDGLVDLDDWIIVNTNQGRIVPMDTNQNGVVERNDLLPLIENWHTAVVGGAPSGDLDNDGFVDEADFSLLGEWFGFPLNGAPASEGTEIPEPSTFALAGLALVGLVGYSRRRS